MNKLLVTLMVVLASANAVAKQSDPNLQWTPIGADHNQEVTYYLDFQSFHKVDQKVTAWELMDFVSPQRLPGAGWNYSSSKLLIEFDCHGRQSRILTFYMYAGNLGSQNIVYSGNFPSAAWAPVPPDSVEKELWNSACGKM